MSRPYTYVSTNPAKMSVSGFMGYLKGKSALLIFQKWGNMKFAYRNREFWCKGYYVDTAGKNTKAIKEYIANQLKHDKESDQLALFDPQAHLWVISNNCMAGRPIKRRTCALPVSFRALPENEIPPAGGYLLHFGLDELFLFLIFSCGLMFEQ